VLNRLADPSGVVHLDVTESLARSTGVKRDDGYTRALHFVDQTRFHFRGHDSDAIDSAVKQSVNAKRHSVRVVFGIVTITS